MYTLILHIFLTVSDLADSNYSKQDLDLFWSNFSTPLILMQSLLTNQLYLPHCPLSQIWLLLSMQSNLPYWNNIGSWFKLVMIVDKSNSVVTICMLMVRFLGRLLMVSSNVLWTISFIHHNLSSIKVISQLHLLQWINNNYLMLISQRMFPHSLPDNILKQNLLTPIFDNKTYNLTGFKVISLNCQSIRSTARRARLRALVYEHSPDIIIGYEWQIDNSYSSAEVFPPGYCVFRKDHCEGAGGVFICIKENLSASAIPSLDTDAEIIWAKIDISKRNPIFICSFYRPPNNLLQPLVKLHESLS